MTDFDHRPARSVLIPWVITLMALFGLNVLAPDFARARKCESPEGIALSHQADDAQMMVRDSIPQELSFPKSSGELGAARLSSLLILIETCRDLPLVRASKGAVRGRAPPAVLPC